MPDRDIRLGVEGDHLILIHDPAIQRLAGLDPFNNNDADGIAFVMHTEMHGHAGKSSLLLTMLGS
jgi:hypothetical protein